MSVKQTAWQIIIGCILLAAGIWLVQMASTQPIGLKKMVVIPVLIVVLIAAAICMKLYMNGEHIFMSAIYLLIALTFLNNAFSLSVPDSLVSFSTASCSWLSLLYSYGG